MMPKASVQSPVKDQALRNGTHAASSTRQQPIMRGCQVWGLVQGEMRRGVVFGHSRLGLSEVARPMMTTTEIRKGGSKRDGRGGLAYEKAQKSLQIHMGIVEN